MKNKEWECEYKGHVFRRKSDLGAFILYECLRCGLKQPTKKGVMPDEM